MKLLLFILITFLALLAEAKSVLAPTPSPREYTIGANYSNISDKYNQFTFNLKMGWHDYKQYLFYAMNFLELTLGHRIFRNEKISFCWKASLLEVDKKDFLLFPLNGFTILSLDKTSLFDTEAKWLQLRSTFILKYYDINDSNRRVFNIVQPFRIKIGISSLKVGFDNYSSFGKTAGNSLFGLDASFVTGININWKYLRINPEVEARNFISKPNIYFLNYGIKLMYSIPELDFFKFYYHCDLSEYNSLNFILRFDYQKAFCGKNIKHNRILNLGIQYHFAGPWELY